MIYRAKKNKAGKYWIVFIVFTMLLFVTLRFSKKAESGEPSRTLKGYIRETTDIKDYYHKYHLISDPDPFWTPKESTLSAGPELVAGLSGLLVDTTTDTVIFSKNDKVKMKIASLVKVMTAVVALEHGSPEQTVTISGKAASIGENSMGVSEGETYTIQEVLYGLILASGNDAAYALAEGTAGDTETFVAWMNTKAKELGLKDTLFYDPSGLDDRSYSTAFDLSRLARYALKSKEVRSIAKTPYISLNSATHKYIYLENQTNLLTSYPGVEGLKTGYTEEAGYCLVTNARNRGHELIGVVLNSVDRRGDMILMLDYAWQSYGIKVDHNLL